MKYLGSIISADGKSSHGLNRRVVLAKADFNALGKIWSQSALTWRKHLRILSSLVESKLFSALATMCFNTADLRRLDGFLNRCVREIILIKPAFVSRVSNACYYLDNLLMSNITQMP